MVVVNDFKIECNELTVRISDAELVVKYLPLAKNISQLFLIQTVHVFHEARNGGSTYRQIADRVSHLFEHHSAVVIRKLVDVENFTIYYSFIEQDLSQ